jgi:LacI family transcriptional regulator
MPVTIRQIAEVAQVSRGTIDKVLNQRPGVSAPVRKRILRLAAELGYRPNAAGKSLAAQKRPVRIGFLLLNAHDPLHQELRLGVERAAEELAAFGVEVDCRILEHVTVAEQVATIKDMARGSLAGLALAPLAHPAVKAELNRLAAGGLRIVTSNTDLPSVDRICFVGQDLKRSGRVAGELMGQLLPGGGNLLVLSGLRRIQAHLERLMGFREVLAETYPGLRIVHTAHDVTDNQASYERVAAFLLGHPAPDGVFLAGLGTAGVGRALCEWGRPDIKFICYDCIPETQDLIRRRIVNFSITQDPFMQGYLPVKILFDDLFHGIRPSSNQIHTRIEIISAENL